MIRYIFKRLLWMIPVILGVIIIIFTIMYFTPGDPATIQAGNGATADEIELIRKNLQLDDPFIVQLGRYLKDIFLRLDFGKSWQNDKSVWDGIISRLPRTAFMAFVACALQIVIGIPLGIMAAVNQNKLPDRLTTVIAMIGISIPEFWVAMILVLVFALNLNILPAFGITDGWRSWIMPCFCCSIGGIASQMRSTRTYMLEVIRSDYVVTARAKGLRERAILYTHALPNTLMPVITGVGTHFGRALGGTVIIENVFSIPGVGSYMVNAINNRDYPVIRGSTIVLAVLFAMVMVAVDILYAYIDPRIKAQYVAVSARRKVKGNA